jgi:D-glycero-alpha-D-manno-heptose-7-phosphate kinase
VIKNEVLVQSPTRIDFAGGTLDCWPINALMNPVTTINVAIDIYTTCRLSTRDDSIISIHSREIDKEYHFADLQECLDCTDQDFAFFREHIAYWKPNYGFNLSAKSDSPVGGGLGGSSSLSVSIFKAFCELNSLEIDPYEIVRMCSGIEAKILQMPTGTQDYFPPLQGGFNIIDYQFGWPQVQCIAIDDLDINQNISIFFTGRSHHSGINNWQVIKKFIDGDPKTIEALGEIRQVAEQTKAAVLNKEWQQLPNLFKHEFQARMQLAESFSSPEIETLAEVAYESGAEAINICGAGGGGCVFVWSVPQKRAAIIDACCEAGFQHLDVRLV